MLKRGTLTIAAIIFSSVPALADSETGLVKLAAGEQAMILNNRVVGTRNFLLTACTSEGSASVGIQNGPFSPFAEIFNLHPKQCSTIYITLPSAQFIEIKAGAQPTTTTYSVEIVP